MITRCAVVALLATHATLLAQPPVDLFLKDIKTVVAPGTPGSVMALHDNALPVVVGGLDRGSVAPVIVASEWGEGRVVAFGHTGYIESGNLQDPDSALLMQRLLQWCAKVGPAAHSIGKTQVLVLNGDLDKDGPNNQPSWLASHGFTVRKRAKPGPLTPDDLAGGTALIVTGSRSFADQDVKLISAFVKAGGGLVAAQTGWGWQQINGGEDMRMNPLNILLSQEAGIAWTDQTLDSTARDAQGRSIDGFDATRKAQGPLVVTQALIHLLDHDGTPAPADRSAARVRTASLAQASATLTAGYRVLQASDTTVLPRLKRLMNERAAELVPTEKNPLDTTRPLLRTLLAVQVDELNRSVDASAQAHPAAAGFPGPVPPPEQAPRITRTVKIDTRVPRWHSTGLYAAPGDIVTITPLGTAQGQTKTSGGDSVRRSDPLAKNLSVRIGCHTDRLWHLSSWKRVPEISREFALSDAGPTRAANAFGGLVYIVVDSRQPGKGGPVDVEISGCVEAPMLTAPGMSKEDWHRRRNAPAPWGEIQTQSVVVSLPSSVLRTIDDPREIGEVWQAILDHAADLGSIPRERPVAERYVPDLQISAGYMHSGYPIMTHMDAADDMGNPSRLKAGTWGLFHELGHNHQQGTWTFSGTGEVTCNLWSLYLMETIAGKPVGQGHEAINDPQKRADRARRHIDTGADFEKWKNDPFLALEMYLQLREAFGWEPFKTVFAQYSTLPASQRPVTDLQKHDEWMVRMSRATSRNLGPFFKIWGVPTTDEARAQISTLPVWLPASLESDLNAVN